MWNELRDRWVWELRHGGHEFIRKREKWYYPNTGWKRFDAVGVFWDMIERQSFQELFIPRENTAQTHDYWVPTDVKERVLTNMLGEAGCYDVMFLFDLLEYETDWCHAKFDHAEDYSKIKYPHESLSKIIEKWRVDGPDVQLATWDRRSDGSRDNRSGLSQAA